MKYLVRPFVAAALVLGIATAAKATVEDHLGPLAEAVVLGEEGVWRARDSEGWFILANDDDPGAYKYYWLNEEPLASGERAAAITVLPRGGNPAVAGLLFHHQGDDDFIAFTIGSDGGVALTVSGSGGWESQFAEGLRPALDGNDLLEIRETPGRAVFLLNGQQAFVQDNPQGFSGRVGVIAAGTGRFAFDGFEVVTTGVTGVPSTPSAPTGDRRGDDDPVARAPGDRRRDEDPAGTGRDQGDPRPGPGPEAPQIDPNEAYVAQVLLGTTLGVFFHEFGHALIGETGLPATGPEEDVADGFSAFVLSEFLSEDAGVPPEEFDFVAGIVRYSALLWYYSGVQKKDAGRNQPWQSEHAPDLKRFRNAFCIIYAANPDIHAGLARDVGLEDRTKERCRFEYAKRKHAWNTILQTVSRNIDGGEYPGLHPPDKPGGKLHLTFEESQSVVGRRVQELLTATGFMRGVMAEMERYVVWPNDVQVVFRDCEEINAWYDPSARRVTMCYGLVSYFSELIFRAEGKGHLIPR
ncbi:MAG: DUF4344 domain-containing metallopeptidase [Pseudomonadota bacterium]